MGGQRGSGDTGHVSDATSESAALGRFEWLFLWIGRYLAMAGSFEVKTPASRCSTSSCGKMPMLQQVTHEHVRHITERVFARPVLDTIFTEDATRWTQKSFTEHFTEVFWGLCQI